MIGLVCTLLACAAGRQQYEAGLALYKAGEFDKAVNSVEKAISAEPENRSYRDLLAQIRNTLILKITAQGRQVIESGRPLTSRDIEQAREKLAQAREVDPTHTAVTDFGVLIEQAQSALESEMRLLFDEAKAAMEAGNWIEADTRLTQLRERMPAYEGAAELQALVRAKGTETFLEKARQQFEKEDFQQCLNLLEKALTLDPGHAGAMALKQSAKERNTKAYFLEQARTAIVDQQWDRAVTSYQKALTYDPDDQGLQQLIGHIRQKAGNFYLHRGQDRLKVGMLLYAFDDYTLADKHLNGQDRESIDLFRDNLCSKAEAVASELKQKDFPGGAWFWYTRIRDIDPDYSGIFFLIQEMDDRLRQRVQKAIAIFDFTGPSNNADAGIILANNLINYLFKNISGDVRIIEREHFKSILQELRLNQTGVISNTTIKEMGRVYDIDVAVMGSVLIYNVDHSISQGTKTVRYQTGSRIEDNIAYLNWKAKNPDPDKEELAAAPPAKITKPVYTEKAYQVAYHKKVGFMQVSFRVVDVRTGENIQLRTLDNKLTVTDETSAGLTEAGIDFDALEIPTDTEMFQKMTEKIVFELGREVLHPLQNIEKAYFQMGEQLLRRQNRLQAAESFVDTIFDEKMKQNQDTSLSARARSNLNRIFGQYKISF